MLDRIQSIVNRSISVKQDVLKDEILLNNIAKLTEKIINVFSNGGKVLFCGNGGSAADAQHLAAEFTGRFYTDRNPLPSDALHCNSSFLTAVANDYGYQYVYSRLLKGIGKPKDILIGLSTSGNSENIMEAFKTAKSMDIMTVAFTGASGGKLRDFSDMLINVPSTDTPRIQECHIMLGHIVCELVEEGLFKKS